MFTWIRCGCSPFVEFVLSSCEIPWEYPADSIGSASAKGKTAVVYSREQQETRRAKREAERGKKKRKDEGRRSDKRIKENFGKFEGN